MDSDATTPEPPAVWWSPANRRFYVDAPIAPSTLHAEHRPTDAVRLAPDTGQAHDPIVAAVDFLFEHRHTLPPDVLRTMADIWVCASAAKYGEPYERFWEDDPFADHDTDECEAENAIAADAGQTPERWPGCPCGCTEDDEPPGDTGQAREPVMTETTRQLARRVSRYRRESLEWLKQAIRADGEAEEANNALIRERQIAVLTKGDGHVDCAIDPSPDTVQAEVDRLRDALCDALEGLQEMRPYVFDYFAEKWDLDGYVLRAKTALGES